MPYIYDLGIFEINLTNLVGNRILSGPAFSLSDFIVAFSTTISIFRWALCIVILCNRLSERSCFDQPT